MAGHGAVFGFGGPFPNVQRAAQLALTVHHRVAPWRRCRMPGPQIARQFLTQRTARLHEQRHIDRLVRHAHLRIVGELFHQPTRDLLRRPPQLELGLHRRPQSWAGRQLRRLRATHPTHRGLVRTTRPIATTTTIALRPPARPSTAHDSAAAQSTATTHRPPDPARSPPARSTTTATVIEPAPAPPGDASPRNNFPTARCAARSPRDQHGSSIPAPTTRAIRHRSNSDNRSHNTPPDRIQLDRRT